MTVDPTQPKASDLVHLFLSHYGLTSLESWAEQQLQAGESAAGIQLMLEQTPQFQARFPAIEERRKAGLPPISPDEYIAYEQQARQIMMAAGFPPSFYDQPQDFHQFIAKDVSASELQQRATTYQQAAYQAPVEIRNQLKTLYGVDEGHLAAYFADPNRALPLIQQQFAASQIAGEAQRQQFGQLSTSEAERLASLGITDAQASQGFGQVSNAAELFKQLPGESAVETNRQTALGVVAGDASAQKTLDAQAKKRQAQFQQGGGFAQSQKGSSGLGSANT